MKLTLYVQNAAPGPEIPTRSQFRQWVKSALQRYAKNDAARHLPEQPALTIRLVDEAESAQLNMTYRQKNYSTNVLSFPSVHPDQPLEPYLGDLVICAVIVIEEARQQRKVLLAHWAHLTVHGVLHLLGYDHVQEPEAQEMEHLETQILANMGFADPYQ